MLFGLMYGLSVVGSVLYHLQNSLLCCALWCCALVVCRVLFAFGWSVVVVVDCFLEVWWGFVFVCMHVCMYVCICVCVYACVYIYVCICVCMYACVYIYVCIAITKHKHRFGPRALTSQSSREQPP